MTCRQIPLRRALREVSDSRNKQACQLAGLGGPVIGGGFGYPLNRSFRFAEYNRADPRRLNSWIAVGSLISFCHCRFSFKSPTEMSSAAPISRYSHCATKERVIASRSWAAMQNLFFGLVIGCRLRVQKPRSKLRLLRGCYNQVSRPRYTDQRVELLRA
jgi:hypothetical protein